MRCTRMSGLQDAQAIPVANKSRHRMTPVRIRDRLLRRDTLDRATFRIAQYHKIPLQPFQFETVINISGVEWRNKPALRGAKRESPSDLDFIHLHRQYLSEHGRRIRLEVFAWPRLILHRRVGGYGGPPPTDTSLHSRPPHRERQRPVYPYPAQIDAGSARRGHAPGRDGGQSP